MRTGLWQNDLSDRLWPMVVKELRQGLRRGTFIYPFLAIQLMAVMAVASEFHLGVVPSNERAEGLMNFWIFFTSGPLWAVVGAVCAGVMPLCGLLLMGQELEEGNHEMLQMTQLSRWKIVIGKFLALWGLCILMLISLLPYILVRYLVGAVELLKELESVATVLGTAAILCAGSIGASGFESLTKRVMVTVLFIISWILGGMIPCLLGSLGSRGGVAIFLIIPTALMAVACYVTIGLALARSHLRLALEEFETNPTALLIAWLVVTPLITLVISTITLGYGGWISLLITGAVAVKIDHPHGALRRPPPVSNIPQRSPESDQEVAR